MTEPASVVIRVCRDCSASFAIDDAEAAFFRRLQAEAPDGEHGRGWFLPTRCVECRQRRRRALFTVRADDDSCDLLTCASCGREFVFPLDHNERQYFAVRGWQRPRRCPRCRRGGGRRG